MSKTKSNEVVFFEEPTVSLKAVVAVNDTTLGTAIATCRLQDYGDPQNATDTALSMAYFNTFRAALLHKPYGGAGLTLCGDPSKIKNEMYFRALGIFINKLNGKFYLVRSSSITHKDMLDIKRESDYLLGIDERYILSNNSPVEAIAKGMIWGLKALVRQKMNKENLEGLSFVVEGVGEVGSNLVKELLKIKNVKITITDIVYDKIKTIQDHSSNIKVVKPHEIYKQKCDVFNSCAVNKIIDEEKAEQLNCKIISGSSNDILANKNVEKILEKKDILYVPGFVINGGEIIQLENEFKGNDPKLVDLQLHEIQDVVIDLFEKAEKEKKSISEIALQTAQDYINNVASIKKLK